MWLFMSWMQFPLYQCSLFLFCSKIGIKCPYPRCRLFTALLISPSDRQNEISWLLIHWEPISGIDRQADHQFQGELVLYKNRKDFQKAGKKGPWVTTWVYFPLRSLDKQSNWHIQFLDHGFSSSRYFLSKSFFLKITFVYKWMSTAFFFCWKCVCNWITFSIDTEKCI